MSSNRNTNYYVLLKSLKISTINMKFHLFVALAFCVAICVVQAEAAPEPIPAARFARQATTQKPGNLVEVDLSVLDPVIDLLKGLLQKFRSDNMAIWRH
ncbi:hypothetical protein CEXT_569361 [Caerostris extrusa]|uniref:Uncharacterized protein n=1 Tax=Caerostris extrusa TaxID=172846 RepID=A0AAV4X0M9_CAEEX|nr:hypothetical protein CEXT_569361 [Caerostris extrusa]